MSTTTTTTTRDRGDRYGPMEWAQLEADPAVEGLPTGAYPATSSLSEVVRRPVGLVWPLRGSSRRCGGLAGRNIIDC